MLGFLWILVVRKGALWFLSSLSPPSTKILFCSDNVMVRCGALPFTGATGRDEALSVTSPFPPALLMGARQGETDHDGARRKHLLGNTPPRPSASDGGPREAGNPSPLSTCPAGRMDRPLCGLQMLSLLRTLISPKAANCLMGKWDANYKALSSTDLWYYLLLTPQWSSHRVDGRSTRPHSGKGLPQHFSPLLKSSVNQHWRLFGIN